MIGGARRPAMRLYISAGRGGLVKGKSRACQDFAGLMFVMDEELCFREEEGIENKFFGVLNVLRMKDLRGG